MNTALRIASVTYILKDLLNNGLINHDVTGAVGETILVTALSPNKIKPEEEGTRLNLFMYQATHNPGWRNVGQPSMNSNGERLSNPPLSIDLHYLLTAYGGFELHTEILLGYAMQLLHENPVLSRDAIRISIAPPSAVPGNGLLSSMKLLSTSGLADQAELIKISPNPLSIEDISKLWAAFSCGYRPTAAYKVTCVLIESNKSTKTALPVKARNVYAFPFKQPVIEWISSMQSADKAPVENQKILPGYIIVLNGNNLDSDFVDVTIDGIPVGDADKLSVKDKQISVQLSAGLNAGIHEVQVVHPSMIGTPATKHHGPSSVAQTFALSPVITHETVDNVTGTGVHTRSANIKFHIDPALANTQKLMLFMNPSDLTGSHAYSFQMALPDPVPAAPFSEITVGVTGIEKGNYLLRVQVDGIESQLSSDTNGIYISPVVSIP